MALLIHRGRITTRRIGDNEVRVEGPTHTADSADLHVALINNMPDSAVEDTEQQFFGLLAGAATEHTVHAKLYCIPSVPRSERTLSYLRDNYFSTRELLHTRVDGAVITGTEPKLPDLRKEPYWRDLAEVLEWAELNTSSTVLSCLAAHAGVLQSDGIGRTPMNHKRFGVFEHCVVRSHVLTNGLDQPVFIPHSRWNEVREEALVNAGYEVLTRSKDAGADLFVKQKRDSLFVHFQGHPEYGERTLFKEYRRDIKRYLRNEREDYPLVPRGYFDSHGTDLLRAFQERAMKVRREEILEEFPEAELTKSLQNLWKNSATAIYRNWLGHLAARKSEANLVAATAARGDRL